MRVVDLITKKRDGGELDTAEIEWFVRNFTDGAVADYQASALAMALFFRGMTARETRDLTLAMAGSGEQLDLSDVVPGIVVDKHSTGGVGDKTTLVVEPIVSACGVPVGKMSGRGLGYSGGTLDKMESFAGYRTQLEIVEFKQQLARIGIVLAGQSAQLAPADGKLYALRDVTGTVPVMPLIASSVMSKKIAAGAQAIVLDVKVGSGAFMSTLEDARNLAQQMVAIGREVGRRTVALLADMNQPLGFAVGNALEAQEAVMTLRGSGPPDFVEHCLTLAAHMLVLAGKVTELVAGRALAEQALRNGSALAKFRELVVAQGGDGAMVDDPALLPQAAFVEVVRTPTAGWLARLDARAVGEAAVLLGAGRAKKGDPIDPAVGLVVHCKVGDELAAGAALFTVHASSSASLAAARAHALQGVAVVAGERVAALPLFYGVVE